MVHVSGLSDCRNATAATPAARRRRDLRGHVTDELVEVRLALLLLGELLGLLLCQLDLLLEADLKA